MKKTCILLTIVFCLLLTGCNNEFAEKEYDSVEKMDLEMLFSLSQ